MIPEANEEGYLPAGVHPAGLDEIETRFGCRTEIRRAQMQSLRWLLDLAVRAGIKRVLIDGSFVTDTPEPNDVDCVLLSELSLTAEAEEEFDAGFPFVQAIVVEQPDFDYFGGVFFATDREDVPKGLIEVTP